jgi:sulfur-carrier protein adenylyltransferase/sulfurtransferase
MHPEKECTMVANVHQIDSREAGKFLDEARLGARTLLDVRQDFEYAEGHLPGALHIPLPELLERVSELDRNLPLLVYCRGGMRSLAAANLLAGQGFREIMSLKGGLLAWEGAQATGPVDLGMASLAEAKTAAVLLERAWGMELSLEDFYVKLAHRAADPELTALFKRLAGFEGRHRRTLVEIWSRLEGGDTAQFEARAQASIRPGTLEGGVEAKEYLGLMTDPTDSAEALELAMAVEAQAMDLYLRRSASETDPDLRRTLLLLAEEERAHLKVLGSFVNERGRF